MAGTEFNSTLTASIFDHARPVRRTRAAEAGLRPANLEGIA